MRSAMVGFALAGIATVASGAMPTDSSPRQQVASWLRRDDALLVVLVFEGLRADVLDAERRDGTSLLPALKDLATRAVVYDDVLTGAPHVAAGAFELLSGDEARHFVTRTPQGPAWPGGFSRLVDHGFTVVAGGDGLPRDATVQAAFPWLFADAVEDLDTFLAKLGAAAATPGPDLALYFCAATLPPYELDDARLDATDPQPWMDAPAAATMDQLVERRRGTARTMSRVLRYGQALGTRRHTEVFGWLARAAAIEADDVVAQLGQTLQSQGLADRASVIVTSTLGTATGDRGIVGAGGGVGLGHVAVPLLWQLPGNLAAAARSPFPAQPRDVSSTLASLLESKDLESGADLFDAPPTDRVRVAVAWFERAGSPQAEFRLTTPELTLLVGSDGVRGLFDRRWDRLEFQDLAAREPALVQTARRQLQATLWGASPALWILVKGEPEGIVSGVVRGAGLRSAEGEEIESLDSIRPGQGRIDFSFVTDAVDVVKIPLPAAFDDITVEIQSRASLGLGASAIPTGRTVRLGAFSPQTLWACVGPTALDPRQWLADRSAGVTMWIVSR